MYCEDHQSVSFLKEGEDEDFEKIMKNLQDFSGQFMDDNDDHKIDYEAHSAIKSLDNYYDNKMNFDKNEMITPPKESMKKLDNLYDKIMESKNGKDLSVEKNREYMGDPKESEPLSKKGTLNNSNSKKNLKSKSNSNRQSLKEENPNTFQCLQNENKDKKESDYYELITMQSQEEKFDKSYYEYPVMKTLPEINNVYQSPQINYYQNNNYVEGRPIYIQQIQPPQNSNYQNVSAYYQQPQPRYSFTQNSYNYYPPVGPFPSNNKFGAFEPNIN